MLAFAGDTFKNQNIEHITMDRNAVVINRFSFIDLAHLS